MAEYIVWKALDCLKGKRIEWDAHDLVTDDGIKIEVKSAAYVQSWEQKKPSEIRFDIGRKQSWFAEINTFSVRQERSADMYVFCILTEKNCKKIDPLETDQWLFIILPSEIINKKFGNQKTVSLSSLKNIGGQTITFQELQAEIKRVMR